jgi:thymidylate kinase
MAACSEVPQQLLGLFKALHADGITWCLLRPRELLAQPEGDVDMLVAPHQLATAAAVMIEHGFVAMGRDHANRHGLDRDEATGRFLWVHLQTGVTVAGESVAADSVLGSRTGELPQAGDAWLFWILALRAILEKPDVPERQREHLQRLALHADAGPEAALTLARRRGLEPAQVVALCRVGDWSGLRRLRPARPSPPPAGARQQLRRAARAVVGAARLLQGRHPGARGISVAIVGPDGAGKTTLVTTLTQSLPLPTRIQYLGLTGGRIYRADKLRLPGLVFVARVLVLWSRFLRGAYHRAQGRVVLFERYVLDAAVPSGIPLGPVARFSRSLQRWVLPLPDLVLLLDASGETMHRRSGEYDAERLEQWRAAFASLRRSVHQLEVIDAERPQMLVRRDAEALIWRYYRARRNAS